MGKLTAVAVKAAMMETMTVAFEFFIKNAEKSVVIGGDGEIRTRGGGYPPRRFSKPLVSATHPRLHVKAACAL
jgi:hypothetical protein